jgi:hypothetical protein
MDRHKYISGYVRPSKIFQTDIVVGDYVVMRQELWNRLDWGYMGFPQPPQFRTRAIVMTVNDLQGYFWVRWESPLPRMQLNEGAISFGDVERAEKIQSLVGERVLRPTRFI